MRTLLRHLEEAVQKATMPDPLRRYAVVNAKTGKLEALIDAATFSQVSMEWVPDNMGAGEWLIFSPPNMLGGSPNFGQWWRPIRSRVTADGGKFRAEELRGRPGDEKFAPPGYEKE